MVSEMAMEDVERLEKEGCHINARDIIRLNALGLKLEKQPDFRLASLPRIAVLGNVILRQPTISQDIFLDDASLILSNDPATMLALEAYVLAHPEETFEKLKHPVWFVSKCKLWVKKNLGNYQATEVRRALDFCLYGTDSRTGERPVYLTDDNEKFYELPDSPLSKSLRLWFSAVSMGMDSVAALKATSPQLEAMLERASILNELAKCSDLEKVVTAEYFSTLEDIKRKAYEERDKKNVEVTNGEPES